CIDVTGPFEDGRIALVIRVHHCMADGVTALRMLSSLLWDRGNGAEPGPPQPWNARRPPSRMRLLSSGIASQARALGGAISDAGRGIASPARWRETGRELAALPGTLRRELWPLGAD